MPKKPHYSLKNADSTASTGFPQTLIDDIASCGLWGNPVLLYCLCNLHYLYPLESAYREYPYPIAFSVIPIGATVCGYSVMGEWLPNYPMITAYKWSGGGRRATIGVGSG